MVDIAEAAENIYQIDALLYSVPRLSSVYLINEERKALIDSGPTTSVNTVLEGIKKVGVKPDDIDYVIVTHIHLDHAGGAGVLVKSMPKAQVVVHHRGFSGLVNSVKKISGEETVKNSGEVVPIGVERIKAVYEGDVIGLSERQTLRFIDAPGHAPHELCICESRNNGLFVGDAVGMHHVDANGEVLLPITPPPSFNMELYLSTLQRLMKLNATAIYFAHFGASNRVSENLQKAADILNAWNDVLGEALEKKVKFDAVEEKIIARSYAEIEPARGMRSVYEYLAETLIPLNVAGFRSYYQQKLERDKQEE